MLGYTDKEQGSGHRMERRIRKREMNGGRVKELQVSSDWSESGYVRGGSNGTVYRGTRTGYRSGKYRFADMGRSLLEFHIAKHLSHVSFPVYINFFSLICEIKTTKQSYI